MLRYGVLCFAAVLVGVGCTALLDTASLSEGSGGGNSSGWAGGGTGGTAGSAATAGTGGGAGRAGSSGNGGNGGSVAAGAAGTPDCVPSTELCDGVDNDCDPATPDVCPAHCTAHLLDGRSYMSCAESRTFNSAEMFCQVQDMHLVKINDVKENAAMLDLTQGLSQRAWIGASETAPGVFTWLDGQVILSNGTPDGTVYQNFGNGQPATLSGPACLEFYSSSGTQQGQWVDALCTTTANFVCERY